MAAKRKKAPTRDPANKRNKQAASTARAPKADQVKFVLRIHPDVHSKIKAQAADNFQSMNEFIHQKMAEAVDGKNSPAALIRSLERKLKNKGVI